MEQNGLGARGAAICEVPGGYLLFCDQITDDGNFQTHAMVRRLDEFGEVLSVRDFLSESARHSNHGIVDPVQRTASGMIAVPVIDDSTGFDRNVSILMCNDLGDTVITYRPIQCNPMDSVVVTMRGMRATSGGGFLVVGSIDSTLQGQGTRALLSRIDPQGELIRATDYGSPDQLFAGVGAEPYLEDGAVIFGYRLAPGIDDMNFLIRVNGVGEELWRRFMGSEAGASYGSVKVSPDGNIVTWCRYDEDGEDNYWETVLCKWDPDGGLIWQKRANHGYQTSTFDMEVLDDGTFIATVTVDEKGLLCKYSADGDSLWTRTHTVFSNTAYHILWDVEPTSDGGFVACGEVIQSGEDPQPGLATIWMIKTDALGCVVPGCQNVGVQEYVLDLTEQLQLSPNPASDKVQVRLPLPEQITWRGAVQAVVQDARGAEVLRMPLTTSQDLIAGDLDVSGLCAGTYHVHVVGNNRWLAGGKVVVAH
ncbi:MAG TPA: hypothetical protein PLB89_03015 [Flavobacteriales bacterium]|nr:hypothetical protein [Flavobacteriales bacterium]